MVSICTCICIEQGRTITAHHGHFVASTCTVHVAGASTRQSLVLFLVVMVDFALGSKGVELEAITHISWDLTHLHKLMCHTLTTALCLQSTLHFFRYDMRYSSSGYI